MVRWIPPTFGGKALATIRVLGISTASLSCQSVMSSNLVPLPAQLDALERGSAIAPLPGWRTISVEGGDAWRWLQDLVTAGLADLDHGQSRRSLLLTPTGRIRADFHVARLDQGFLLLQDPEQTPIDALLEPYVLSSDVAL